MSTPPPTPGADPAADAVSIRHIRALFQRKLVDRARTLADARWPGSGQMVALASEWSALSPTERRARLSQIGPEDLARLRTLADLNPDLARVLDDLEKRGVLPPALFTAQQGSSTEEALVDTALNLGEEAVRDVADRAQTASDASASPAATRPAATRLTPLPQAEMPVLDLGLPSTDQFLASEAERRIAATDAAHAVLDRVRQRVERHVERLTTSPAEFGSPSASSVDEVATLQDAFAAIIDAVDISTPEDRVPRPSMTESLVDLLRESQVVVLADGDPLPGAGELTALARLLALPLVDIELRAGELRLAFGGLRRHGPEYVIDAGPLPRALADANLVVVRGSIYSTMLARWRQGFCDIPGTKASSRIDPACRILVLAD